MGIAVNLFHWSPSTFWSATPHEFWAAFDVWREINPPRDDD